MRVLIEACPSAVHTWLTNLLSNPQGLSLGTVVDPQGEVMRTYARLVLQQLHHAHRNLRARQPPHSQRGLNRRSTSAQLVTLAAALSKAKQTISRREMPSKGGRHWPSNSQAQ